MTYMNLYLDKNLTEKLKIAVRESAHDSAFAEKWEKALADFHSWESSGGQNTSLLNGRLFLLKQLDSAFPEAKLFKNGPIVDLLLSGSGILGVGDSLKCRISNTRAENAKIVAREITERMGVEYTLETVEGFRFTREFFD
jgi:hypothetical protein